MPDPTRSRHTTPATVSSLAQWLDHHGQQLKVSIKGRVRQHSLHLLCESVDPSGNGAPPPTEKHPPSQRMVSRYFQTHVTGAEINQLIGTNLPRIRHLWIYGRIKGAKQPAWSVSMPLVPTQPPQGQSYSDVPYDQSTSPPEEITEKTALPSLATLPQQTDWYTLAEQGHPHAIAHYLRYILANLGVNAKVSVNVQRQRPNTLKDRLWITCRGSYCPAATLVGKPIARQLRALSLANIEDAILRFQVSGEDTPDWVLRIDLTPQEEILKEWARWGDVEAISRLVNQRLKSCDSQLLEATLKDTTLHLSCAILEPAIAPSSQPNPTEGTDPQVETHSSIPAALLPLLTELAPQGIHSAVVYGQQADSTTPAWVEWMDLPAKDQLDRAVTPLELATNGDGEAIAFLLRRLLNADLNTQLATGGTRIQVLTKTPMMHVMCDAPTCPAKDEVVPQMERLLRSLELPGIKGIRLYGRRAGQRSPRWHHGIDFGTTTTMVPEPTPQFAATDAYVTELVARTTEPILRPDLTPSELWDRWQTWGQRVTQRVRRSLLSSHLFVPTADSPELMLRSTPRHATVKTAIVWAAVGILALVQTDLGLRQLVRLPLNHRSTPSTPASPPTPADSIDVSATIPLPPPNHSVPESPVDQLPPTQSVGGGHLSATLANSPYPSFNSDQLDYKLALYYQRLLEVGPPDVLIVGSSRALRGIDPVVLEQALTDLGYADAEVFNFGINGATAQVVELILQEILLPEQLPKLIIWADGARAFNSGRDDRTYNGILASEGYEQLLDGSLVRPSVTTTAIGGEQVSPGEPQTINDLARSLSTSYQSLDERLSNVLAHISTAYDERDRLKAIVQQGLTALLPAAPTPDRTTAGAIAEPNTQNQAVPSNDSPNPSDRNPEMEAFETSPMDFPESLSAIDNIDNNGFLPLSIRFDPAQYYQQYARVPGNYDKDYSNFQLDGRQSEALQTIVNFGQTYDIPIIFINLPLTQDYLDPFRITYEQTFRQYMLNLALQQEHFVFRDLGQVWIEDTNHRSYFSDPSHLNQYGAYEVSQHISKDPMIPWDVTTQPSMVTK